MLIYGGKNRENHTLLFCFNKDYAILHLFIQFLYQNTETLAKNSIVSLISLFFLFIFASLFTQFKIGSMCTTCTRAPHTKATALIKYFSANKTQSWRSAGVLSVIYLLHYFLPVCWMHHDFISKFERRMINRKRVKRLLSDIVRADLSGLFQWYHVMKTVCVL